MSGTTIEFYRARVAQARAEADAATLAHVRERCLRSEEAWTHLAERAERQLRLRHEQEEHKAKQIADQKNDEFTEVSSPGPALFAVRAPE